VLDIALASQQPTDLPLIHVEPKGAESGLDKGPNQGQSHVAQADNADGGRLTADALF
jgi:hypothetical protein